MKQPYLNLDLIHLTTEGLAVHLDKEFILIDNLDEATGDVSTEWEFAYHPVKLSFIVCIFYRRGPFLGVCTSVGYLDGFSRYTYSRRKWLWRIHVQSLLWRFLYDGRYSRYSCFCLASYYLLFVSDNRCVHPSTMG